MDCDEEPIVSTSEDAQHVEEPRKALSVGMAATFIVAAMCGSGILALPRALVDAGWAGIPFMILCGLLSSFTGNILGKCWKVLRERYPEYKRTAVPDPYPEIGFRAAGTWGRYAARFCMIATLFGGATVFLLLISQNMSNLLENLAHVHMHACFWILIFAAVLTPLTWLATPKDFWLTAVIAAGATILGGILVVIGLASIADGKQVPHSNPSFANFFNSFGTILFAFGGASVFPTIQVDMRKPEKFPVAVVIGIMSVLTIYIPVSVSGFVVLGDNMKSTNIVEELNAGFILYAVIILITFHLFMAILIVVNPINQELDKLFNVEDKFSIKRCLIRTCTMLLVLFVALTIPHFGVILSLFGGTTVTATNFIFPPLFYLLLARQKVPSDGYGPPPDVDSISAAQSIYSVSQSQEDDVEESDGSKRSVVTRKSTWSQIEMPLYIKVLLYEIMLIGVVGGAASTYSVILSLVDGSSGFSVPCYVNWATADS